MNYLSRLWWNSLVCKVLAFIHPCNETINAGDIEQKKKHAVDFTDPEEKELSFVHWYEILGE